MIILISLILTFAISFVTSTNCIVHYFIHCSEKKWQNFKNAIDKARIKEGM